MMLTAMYGCSGGDSALNDQAARAGSGQGISGPPGSDGGGALGGGGGVDAWPTVTQSLFDFTQTGIAPWGPVIATFQVPYGGGTQTVKQLSSSDPFTAMYQLENGDLVLSNEPLEELVAGTITDPQYTTETWHGPNGDEVVFTGHVLVDFSAAATQQQIERLIAEHNLHVVISWFEPPEEPGTGNAMASFFFRYDPVEFQSVDDAVAYYSSHPLVEGAGGDEVYALTAGYTQGAPNDWYYTNDEDRHISILNIDDNPDVDWGPPFGQWIATTTVAVIDDGVFRGTQDFAIPGYPSEYRKISWCGITADDKSVIFGYHWGYPTEPDRDPDRDGALVTHGTQVAGTITACTNNFGIGSSGVAPQIGVIPARLRVVWLGDSEKYSGGSFIQAVVALRKFLPNAAWIEDVRVTNCSLYAGPITDPWQFVPYKWVMRDIARTDRLWVACAGNDHDELVNYPAAIPQVLGVSGLYAAYTYNGSVLWYPYLGTAQMPLDGSAYWRDQGLDPYQRAYQVSGIYGFKFIGSYQEAPWAILPATPTAGAHPEEYRYFHRTSFSAPQVSGLAALLFEQRPQATSAQVMHRIIDTRNTTIEGQVLHQYDIPLAGLVDYAAALDGWGN